MRKIICTTILLVAITGLCLAEVKIAYVDVDKVYNQCSEKAEAEQQFNQEVSEWQMELDAKEQELSQLKQEYENFPPIVTEERKEEKLALIEKREREFYELANEIRNRAAQKQLELLQPITEKIISIISEIAETNKYDIVLNSMQREVVIYGNTEFDITDLVIEKLNESTE